MVELYKFYYMTTPTEKPDLENESATAMNNAMHGLSIYQYQVSKKSVKHNG